MRTLIKLIGTLVLAVVVAAAVFLGVASVTEYRPKASEALTIRGEATAPDLAPGDELTLLSFNIGYGGLGKNQDFFMDGGDMVRPPERADVEANLDGIVTTIKDNPADVYLLQEVDSDSHRSYDLDQVARLSDTIGATAAYAPNFKSMFTPYPWPPIGKVDSGLVTITGLEATEATRVALPVPFDWPVRLFNLKRCLLVERVEVAGGKELVLVNLHLEAYEDGAGRAEQMAMLVELLLDEYAKGNYVIAGGDFNQSFPGVDYPKVSDNWTPGVFDAAALPAGWTVANDASAPTSRLNDAPWDGDNQLYGIDGFIASPNVEVKAVQTLDEDFEFSDHNPVKLTAALKN
ncbi:MAG: endonuclease/exonuclease/phosphatase family protein [Bifidobacteriaceae bacterium]|jgi:endonuclease/exonuclease/phosphatase family metal-dependent hydrolase|nr:endonuclease/exonuclease/phosphatase family protein [Bifidobacteriaceae bacterium]